MTTTFAVEHAVFDGRFQPPHIGHVAVIRAIVEQFKLPTVVMVIESAVGGTDPSSITPNPHHDADRNPLTVWERIRLLDLGLTEAGLAEQVSVRGIPRPDLHWTIARSFYPPCRFICLTGKDNYELAKTAFWTALGERWKLVDCTGVPDVSSTLVKDRLRAESDWEQLLAPAVLEEFVRIDGPERFRAAAQ